MRRLNHSFLALIGSLLICGAALAQDKVVYHIDNAEAQATKGLRNIRNHLDVAPETKIIVVTHADGVDFLMERQFGAHRVDHALVVGLAEDRAAGHEGVGAGIGHAADVVDLDAAVDLEPDVAPAGVDQLARRSILRSAESMKLCPPKPGLTLMISTRSTCVDHPVQHVQRRGRVEHQPGLLAFGLDELQRAVDMAAGVGVEADQVGPGLRRRPGPARPPAAPSGARRSARVPCLRSAWQTIGPKVRLGT
jgi:intracellular sulfur oxidation DsrE/DsrF family protein